MGLTLTRPLIVFELETTGVDPRRDRIIELATIKLRPDVSRETKGHRLNPGIPIPREATHIHGNTDAAVRNAPPFAKVAHSIHAYFSGCDLAGYNVIHFDIPLLQAELERASHPLDISQASVVDAYRIFRTKEPRTLAGAVRFYCNKEYPEEDYHQAPFDTGAALEVLEAQLNRYPDLPRNPYNLDQYLRDPEYVDRSGKLRWMDGEVAISFGRHSGKTLRQIATTEPDYIEWMLRNQVISDATHHLKDALEGHFAVQKTAPNKTEKQK